MIHSSPTATDQDGVPRFVAMIGERRKAIAICILASCTVAALGYTLSPTRFKSEATLALDVRKLQALPTESVVSPLPQESPVLRTELDIIGSRSMAERVLASLQEVGPIDSKGGRYSRPHNTLPASLRLDEVSMLSNELMQNVRVVNDGRSYTIYIAYYDEDADYAAKVANAYGEAYINYQIELQTSATRRVAEWLGERLGDLRTKLEKSESRASEFREKSGLIDSDGTPLQAQRLSGLNTELTALQAKLSGARARVETALEVQKSGKGLGLTEVLSSPTIQLLRAEQSRLIRAIEEINESGARMNPQLPQYASQLASLQKQINLEISQVVFSLHNEIEISEKQQHSLEAKLREVQETVSAANVAVVQSAQLDREAAADRSIYETYLTRYKQTIEQDGIATAEARIISKAMASASPTSPSAGLWGLVAALLGGASGLVAAFVLNFTDRSIGSTSTLQHKSGLAIIGRIPRMPTSDLTNRQAVTSSDTAEFYSAFADLQAYFQLTEDKARVIVFTSSTDQEGRAFVVANLARSLALSGVKLVVIDANLRNPTLGREFNVKPAAHLACAVGQHLSFDDVIQRDQSSCVDVIIAQPSGSPPNLILGSKQFAALISEVKLRYELILIDAPPVKYDLDLLRIATLADTVTLVVEKDFADGASIYSAVLKLRLAGRHISGIVLNGVPLPRRSSISMWFATLTTALRR